MVIRDISVTELKPYENNPRKNDEAVSIVKKSIVEFGFKVPIIITSDKEIVCGHTRLRAAKELGMDTVPCIIADDLTEEQIKAFRLVDNKTNEYATWDIEKLNAELDALKITDLDMATFGFILPDTLEVEEDEFDAAAAYDEIKEPVTKPGQIWLLGKHRLMCGDSTDTEAVNRLMDGNTAHMILTDPPWNVNYGADMEKDNPQHYRPRQILNDSMTHEEFHTFLGKAFTNMREVSVAGAMVYVFMSAQEWGSMMDVMNDTGFHWSSTIIWVKDQLVLSRKDYHTQYEPVWYGWKEGPRIHQLEDRKQSDIWECDRPKVSVDHPTMKPLKILERAIKNSSIQKENILDLFGGSGSTLIAAEQLGRSCFMMELDPKYCDVIVRRWEEVTGNKACTAA